MIDIYFFFVLAMNLIFFMLVIYNFFTAPRISESLNKNRSEDFISVLIPARNEESNIGRCINTVREQSHENLEILVLDDQSTDRTNEIVEELTRKDSRVKLIIGRELPKDWLGKNWACHQLAEYAKGNLFLFIDADVELRPHAIESALNFFKEMNVQLLSVFPSQKINSVSTYIVTPLMNWLLLNFLPLIFVRRKENNSFVAANGQFMLFDASVYKIVGGHQSVKDKVVEDMELARKIKSANLKMVTALGDKMIYCKMYSSLSESFNGFTKNFFAGFGNNIFSFIPLLALILLVFLAPLVLALVEAKFILIVVLIMISRMLVSIMSNQNSFMNIFLHPLQMIMLQILGVNSIFKTYKKIVLWKGRKIF